MHLEEIGVSLNLKLRRSKFAPYQTRKEALRVPKANKINKTKNITYDMAGTKLGNIHMTKQVMAEVRRTRESMGVLNFVPPFSNYDFC